MSSNFFDIPKLRKAMIGLALGFLWIGVTASRAEPSLQDPTRPPANLVDRSGIMRTINEHQAPEPQRFVLSAVLVAQGRRIAVINSEPVHRGDRIGSAEVITIHQDKVELLLDQEPLTIHLISSKVKQIPAKSR